MCVSEQVDKLILDMKQLIEDLYGTDNENIDFNQLRELSKFSRGYSADISCLIEDKKV